MREFAQAFAARWQDACNSRDIDRIAALYSDTVVFKSPRVCTMLEDKGGALHGKTAVRDYWQRLFEIRPNLTFTVGAVFAGVDSIALEYRVGDTLHGIEFMALDENGLILFAAGNDSL